MTSQLDTWTIVIGLFGGLALFLYGMELMTDALKAAAGERMRAILRKLTGNRVTAAITGALVTSVIQSSSVTTVLVVGFISAGLMSLTASVGVIMGANVGTTITAQIIAFKVTKYALVLIALGFGMQFVGRGERTRQSGQILLGLGLVFFGMDLMSQATEPLRSFQPFIETMQSMRRPMAAILASATFTALVQSSSATTGIVIVLASQGFISLETGIALALGANIGTCVTALLAATGKPRAALQAATVHVLFNVLGVLLWIGLIGVLADLVRSISPVYVDLGGAEKLAAETPRQIANAHTLFNVANTLLFLPMAGVLAGWVERLVPIKPASETAAVEPRFLDDVYLDTPALALDRLRLELGHLGTRVLDVLRSNIILPAGRDSLDVARDILGAEHLYHEMLRYSRRLSQSELSQADVGRLEAMLSAANHLQNIADTVGVNLESILHEWDQRGLHASRETRDRFGNLSSSVTESVALAVESVEQVDSEKADAVIGLKGPISRQADDLARHLASRLTLSDEKDVAVYRYESEAIELLKRIYYFAKRIAKCVPQMAGESSKS